MDKNDFTYVSKEVRLQSAVGGRYSITTALCVSPPQRNVLLIVM